MIARASGTLLVLNRFNAESVETVVGTAPDKLGKTERTTTRIKNAFYILLAKRFN